VDEAWLKRKPSEVPHSSVVLTGALQAHEKEAIEAALTQSHGRISGATGAAAKLGIPGSTLEAKSSAWESTNIDLNLRQVDAY